MKNNPGAGYLGKNPGVGYGGAPKIRRGVQGARLAEERGAPANGVLVLAAAERGAPQTSRQGSPCPPHRPRCSGWGFEVTPGGWRRWKRSWWQKGCAWSAGGGEAEGDAFSPSSLSALQILT